MRVSDLVYYRYSKKRLEPIGIVLESKHFMYYSEYKILWFDGYRAVHWYPQKDIRKLYDD